MWEKDHDTAAELLQDEEIQQMLENEMPAFARELGLKGVGTYFGIVDGWPITCGEGSDFITGSPWFSVPVDTKGTCELRKQINAVLKPWGGRVHQWDQGVLHITDPHVKKMPGTRTEYIHLALQALTDAGLKPTPTCPLCKQPGCDCASDTPKGYRLTHRRCLEAYAQNVRGKADYNKNNGSTVLGLVGALLGMVIGTLPNVICAYFLEMEYVLLYALIPLSIYFFYKLFRGKMRRSTRLWIVLFSVLGIVLMDVELIAVYVVAEGFTIAEGLQLGVEFLFDGTLFEIFGTELLLQLLFTGLALFLTWSWISRTPEEDASVAELALELITPYPADENYR